MKRNWHFALLEIQVTSHSICRTFDGFQITFGGGNTALFNINSSTSNTLQVYNTTGTPAIGVGTNTSSGNGGDNNDF